MPLEVVSTIFWCHCSCATVTATALILLLLSYYYCFHITPVTSAFPGAAELTTQLLRLISILCLPLCRTNKFGLYYLRRLLRSPILVGYHSPKSRGPPPLSCRIVMSLRPPPSRRHTSSSPNHELAASLSRRRTGSSPHIASLQPPWIRRRTRSSSQIASLQHGSPQITCLCLAASTESRARPPIAPGMLPGRRPVSSRLPPFIASPN